MRYLLFILSLIMMSASCKKTDNPASYTVQGKLLIDGTSLPYVNVPVDLYVTRGGGLSGYVTKDLGSAKTDANGYFSITYIQTDITGADPSGGPSAQIHLSSQWSIFDNIPVNENVNRVFTHPTKGSVKINLYTSNPLETNHDTLFLGRYAGTTPIIDTIITTVNGLYKTYTVPVGGFGIYYGRGSKKFGFNPITGYFSGDTKDVSTSISGDPIVDKMTINY